MALKGVGIIKITNYKLFIPRILIKDLIIHETVYNSENYSLFDVIKLFQQKNAFTQKKLNIIEISAIFKRFIDN